MRTVVSDSGPMHYLVPVDAVEILPKLFGRVLIPEVVALEPSHPATPSVVRACLQATPSWLERGSEPASSLRAPPRGACERRE